jgi:hypothetical protein
MATGIRQRGDSWEAFVYDRRTRKKLRKTFPTLAAARAWRHDAASAVRRGALRPATATTLREAWDGWLGRSEARSGAPKPR